MGRGLSRRWPFVVLAAVLLLLGVATPAHAAFPGTNGKIAFSATNTNPTYPNTDIFAINADSSGLVQIVNENDGTWEDSNFDDVPEWSPDGTRLVFNSIWIEGGDPEPSIDRVNADGTGRVVVRPARYNPGWSPDGTHVLYALGDPGAHDEPGDERGWLYTSDPAGANETLLRFIGARPSKASWSPDGTRIAFPQHTFGCINDCQGDIYTANASDGGGTVQLTSNSYDEIQPDWSPDGTKIAFASKADGDYDIYSMNRDGTGILQLTNAPGSDITPSWSPDGTKIAFASNRNGPFHVFTMSANGSGASDLIAGEDPDWQPIPVNSYIRPKGASPVELSLVPAYQPCTAANRTHGPPLAFPSCAPPQRTPGQLTVGTADSNQRPTKSVSIVRIGVLAGNPSTPADEADLRLYGTVNDVRLASDLSDYTGQLEARLTVRITDKDNTPHPGGPGAATVQDITYSFPIQCSETADTAVGGDCTFETTGEALVPGLVKELRRSVWELGGLRVYDGTGSLFMTQGIFVP